MDVTYKAFDGSLDDAAGLLEVEAACWNESMHSPHSIQSVLVDDEIKQVCWLALGGGEAVGLMHAFQTFDSIGRAIWEMDLLAVHPDWRGRGIGTELVRRAAQARPDETAHARAFVEPSNVASQKAFERSGFAVAGERQQIFERETADAGADAVHPRDVTLQRIRPASWRASSDGQVAYFDLVYTVLYDGLWLSGGLTARLVEAACVLAEHYQLDKVGVVTPLADAGRSDLLKQTGFDNLGTYDMWLLPGNA